jgi:hypothetical protein
MSQITAGSFPVISCKPLIVDGFWEGKKKVQLKKKPNLEVLLFL